MFGMMEWIEILKISFSDFSFSESFLGRNHALSDIILLLVGGGNLIFIELSVTLAWKCWVLESDVPGATRKEYSMDNTEYILEQHVFLCLIYLKLLNATLSLCIDLHVFPLLIIL